MKIFPMRMRVGLIALVAATSAACRVKESGDFELKDFYLTYAVTEQGGGQREASAFIREDGPNGENIRLSAGDTIRCDDTELTAPPSGAIETTYAAALTKRGQTDSVFIFHRGSTNQDFSQSVPAPLPFKITSTPPENLKGATFTVTWAPANTGGKIELRAVSRSKDVDCLRMTPSVTDLAPADTGAVVLEGPRAVLNVSIECWYDLEVRRGHSSSLGPPFGGGEIISTHVETIPLRLH